MRHTMNVNETETERHLLWWVKFVENRKTHQPLHVVYFQHASSACSNHLSLSRFTDKSVAFKWLSACKWAKTVKVDEQINRKILPTKRISPGNKILIVYLLASADRIFFFSPLCTVSRLYLCYWQSFFCCQSLVQKVLAAAVASADDSSFNSNQHMNDSFFQWHFNHRAKL